MILVGPGQIAGRRVRQAAGVVHPDRKAAKLGDHAFRELLDRISLRDVGGNGQGASPERADLGSHRIQIRRVPRGNGHIRAGLGEGDSPTDPLASAGNDRHLAIQAEPIEHAHRVSLAQARASWLATQRMASPSTERKPGFS